MEKGYDGIIYKNKRTDAVGEVYIPFAPDEQIVPFNVTDRDILSELGSDATNLA
jgi:hypothetical protein